LLPSLLIAALAIVCYQKRDNVCTRCLTSPSLPPPFPFLLYSPLSYILLSFLPTSHIVIRNRVAKPFYAFFFIPPWLVVCYSSLPPCVLVRCTYLFLDNRRQIDKPFPPLPLISPVAPAGLVVHPDCFPLCVAPLFLIYHSRTPLLSLIFLSSGISNGILSLCGQPPARNFIPSRFS